MDKMAGPELKKLSNPTQHDPIWVAMKDGKTKLRENEATPLISIFATIKTTKSKLINNKLKISLANFCAFFFPLANSEE